MSKTHFGLLNSTQKQRSGTRLGHEWRASEDQSGQGTEERYGGAKGKEEYLYSAILADTPLTKRSDMDHTVLPAIYTTSAKSAE